MRGTFVPPCPDWLIKNENMSQISLEEVSENQELSSGVTITLLPDAEELTRVIDFK